MGILSPDVGLTLAGHQASTRAVLSLPSSTRQWTENTTTKSSWVEIRQGKMTYQLVSRAKLTQLGKISLLLIKSEKDNGK